ncbi:hypothetical protein EDD16DRAFT_1701092 [Pisolithus croceorrhizus]|nr:hypothetical protein F5141DRAFT_1213386 [Pisolithus sp. B1]KAI6123952.1 hypothetical protein EV401DRAFT_2069175 [Pisolithus croceorrhizus]KAI6129660.1 hypothetical protein EDD16DRAFT_1701092 [Pisolithus croceorrhizus]
MTQSDRPTSTTSSTSSSRLRGALPSVTHSLAQLPTMSSLPNDMLYYNSAPHSRAMMEYALQKQSQQVATQQSLAALSAYDTRRTPSPSTNEDTHITVRRQQNGRQTKSRDRS